MQMHEQIILTDGQEQPISRTYQYRKVGVILTFQSNNNSNRHVNFKLLICYFVISFNKFELIFMTFFPRMKQDSQNVFL